MNLRTVIIYSIKMNAAHHGQYLPVLTVVLHTLSLEIYD